MTIKKSTVMDVVLGVLMFPILFGVFVLLLLAGFMIGNTSTGKHGKTRRLPIRGFFLIC